MLWGSSALSEFRTLLSKVLTVWHCVKVKQRYHSLIWKKKLYLHHHHQCIVQQWANILYYNFSKSSLLQSSGSSVLLFLYQTLLKVQHKNIMTTLRESNVFAGCLSFIPIKMVPFGGWKCKGHNFGPENWAINGKTYIRNCWISARVTMNFYFTFEQRICFCSILLFWHFEVWNL